MNRKNMTRMVLNPIKTDKPVKISWKTSFISDSFLNSHYKSQKVKMTIDFFNLNIDKIEVIDF